MPTASKSLWSSPRAGISANQIWPCRSGSWGLVPRVRRVRKLKSGASDLAIFIAENKVVHMRVRTCPILVVRRVTPTWPHLVRKGRCTIPQSHWHAIRVSGAMMGKCLSQRRQHKVKKEDRKWKHRWAHACAPVPNPPLQRWQRWCATTRPPIDPVEPTTT